MVTVYVLEHRYDRPERPQEIKRLGIYSNRERAERRLRDSMTMPGFRNYPDGFIIKEVVIDKDLWEKGMDSLS